MCVCEFKRRKLRIRVKDCGERDLGAGLCGEMDKWTGGRDGSGWGEGRRGRKKRG